MKAQGIPNVLSGGWLNMKKIKFALLRAVTQWQFR